MEHVELQPWSGLERNVWRLLEDIPGLSVEELTTQLGQPERVVQASINNMLGRDSIRSIHVQGRDLYVTKHFPIGQDFPLAALPLGRMTMQLLKGWSPQSAEDLALGSGATLAEQQECLLLAVRTDAVRPVVDGVATRFTLTSKGQLMTTLLERHHMRRTLF